MLCRCCVLRQVVGTTMTAIQRDDLALDGERRSSNQEGVDGCDGERRSAATVGLDAKKCSESFSLALKSHELGCATFPIGKENDDKIA